MRLHDCMISLYTVSFADLYISPFGGLSIAQGRNREASDGPPSGPVGHRSLHDLAPPYAWSDEKGDRHRNQ